MHELRARTIEFGRGDLKTMLAIVIEQYGALPRISRMPLEALGDGEVRLMMVTMGYCGRDKSTLGGEKTAAVGRIGHEGAGIVVEAGRSVDPAYVGRQAVVFPFIDGHNIGYDWPDGGKGIFAEFPVVPQRAVFLLPQGGLSLPDWKALALVEPFACCLRGLRRAKLTSHPSVLVLGAGPVGCEMTMLARLLHPSAKILLADPVQMKPTVAVQRGVPVDAGICFSETSELRAKVRAELGNSDPSLVIHANPQKSSLKQAFDLVANQGTVLCFSGIYDWNQQDNVELGAAFDPKAIHYEEYDDCQPPHLNIGGRQVNARGSRGFDKQDFKAAIEMVLSGSVVPATIVTATIPFDERVVDRLRTVSGEPGSLKTLMSPFRDLWD